jgi:glucosamine 6-phosphate synthetase-like amidotransferase/phosphosugar isomerase protein
MCGLAGMLLFPRERSAADWAAIGEFFSQNLVCNEERGWEASGVALVRQDGSFLLYKQPVPSSELVEMETYRLVLDQLGADTLCLLGHTRMPTKGNRWNNANNHPLLAGQVIGVHNGHIENDDQLFQDLALPRRGEVDSEIIFRLLDTVAPFSRNGGAGNGQHLEAYLGSVSRRVSMLRGRYTTLSVDLWNPGRLLALKQDVPLSVHYHRPWQVLCFSSRYFFLRKTFGPEAISPPLPRRRAYLFDAYRLPEQGKEPVGSVAL